MNTRYNNQKSFNILLENKTNKKGDLNKNRFML